MKKCCTVCFIFKLVLIVGGLNWGLVGLGNFLGSNLNVVNLLLGSWDVAENIVYILVGLSGLKSLLALFGIKCPCSGACGSGACTCGKGGECKCGKMKC